MYIIYAYIYVLHIIKNGRQISLGKIKNIKINFHNLLDTKVERLKNTCKTQFKL